MTIREQLSGMFRASVRLRIGAPADGRIGASRFGGAPDVPDGFQWPVYNGAAYGETEPRERPLSFLAQFDCAALAPFDSDRLLPPAGVLSFFYETETQQWGFDPRDEGCARVFWFPDADKLRRAEFPDALPDCARFPALRIAAHGEPSLPDSEDFRLVRELGYDDWDEFEAARDSLGVPRCEPISKLLGWPDVIQGPLAPECELVGRGYYLGNTWSAVVSREEIQQACDASVEGWRLLFQLDVVQDGGFELMFGDCGRLYFYIRTEDLKARRFDRVWLILQCY